MRTVRGRSGSQPAAVVAADQAAWDADVRPRPRRRRLLGASALGLAALLLLAALVASRSDGEGAGMVAMGAASPSTGLSPVEDLGTLPFGENGIAPGDTVPGGGPAPSDPAAAAAAAAGGAAQPGSPAAALGGAIGPGGGAALGVAGGVGAGDGVPVPSTGPGGGAVPQPPAAPGTPGTTVAPTPPVGPPVPPPCSVTGPTAAPNPVKRKGNSGELREDVIVTFSSSSCGNAAFQVAVKGLVVPASSTGGGGFRAVIDKDTPGWNAGDHPITITGGGTSANLTLQVRS